MMASVSRFCQATMLVKSKAKSVTGILFHKHLLLTNLGISLSLSSAGDFLQQRYEMLKSSDRVYNGRRTFNMATAGSTLGFVGHYYYVWLDKFLPGRTWSTVGKKVLIDQLVCSPLMICVFFAMMALIQGSSRDQFLSDMREKSWRLYLADWMVWPAVQVVNYSFLPTQFRVLYDSTISLGYDVYTSYVCHEIPSSTDQSGKSLSESISQQ